MKRRSFIKKAGLATAGVFSVPYILPSGRLFAATGSRIADHVVLCLFAGGVRNLESIQKIEGNLMPNTLFGSESINPQIAPGMSALPSPFSNVLQSQATLYKEFRYAAGATGHFNAHSAVLTGKYNLVDVNLKQRPSNPTVFEYYRKHNSPSMSALNAWWISNSLGPYPALNFSNYPGYGAEFGANYIQPRSVISASGYEVLGNPKNFNTSEIDKINKIRSFCDNNFSKNFTSGDAGVTNAIEDSMLLDQFIQDSYTEALAGQYDNPWNSPSGMSGDMFNVFFAEKVIERFKPELLVVNMQDVDIGHTNFTAYCDNMRKADYALAHLWQTIQTTPGMANNTVLIVVPEHGRNQEPNTLLDSFGRYALDHNNDAMSREIFCLVAGPAGKVVQNQVISTEVGQTIDVVPTIAKVLGFYSDIPGGMLDGQILEQSFN
ncbi:MAG: alkaline phosphatase family protein [Bacteroidia bacterium]|nr:alkaline phosphatase family protein [Bacteroidia bacterium]